MSNAINMTAILLISALAFSQPASVPVIKDASAVAIAQKALAALGGAQSFMDITVSGTTTLHGDTGTVTYPITLRGSGQASVSSSIQKPKSTDTYMTDGSAVCLNGKASPSAADGYWSMQARRIDFIPALSLLREYSDSNVQLQYAGADAVNGQTVDVIALSFHSPDAPPGFDSLSATQRLFYVDRASGSLVKMQYRTLTTYTDDLGVKTEVYYSNYQVVSGFAVPFSQVTYLDGRLAIELVLQSAAFNTGVAADNFAMTCEVANAQ